MLKCVFIFGNIIRALGSAPGLQIFVNRFCVGLKLVALWTVGLGGDPPPDPPSPLWTVGLGGSLPGDPKVRIVLLELESAAGVPKKGPPKP